MLTRNCCKKILVGRERGYGDETTVDYEREAVTEDHSLDATPHYAGHHFNAESKARCYVKLQRCLTLKC